MPILDVRRFYGETFGIGVEETRGVLEVLRVRGDVNQETARFLLDYLGRFITLIDWRHPGVLDLINVASLPNRETH